MLIRLSFTITMAIFGVGLICCVMFSRNNQLVASPIVSDIQLLHVGVFHSDEVSAESGEVWLGFYSTPDGHALIPSTITVEAVYDPLVDDVGETTAKAVSVDNQTSPLFLIKGLEISQRQFIKTLSAEQTILSLGKFLSLRLGDKNEYHLTVYGEGEVGPNGFTSLSNYSLEISKGQLSQELVAYRSTNGAMPSLVWAGDLDGDSQLDLLINAPPHYGASSAQGLFLSSMAQVGNLVQKVGMNRKIRDVVIDN